MGQLKILAEGKSPQAKAQARGKLFERLMAEVLRHQGYEIDKSTIYAGMEIDLVGTHKTMGTPLYAECKYHATPIDAPKLQAFFGKYMACWSKDKRCQGLFIAVPELTNYARGFYKENIEANQEFNIHLLEEQKVIETILDIPSITRPEIIAKSIPSEVGTPGEWLLLYTDKGSFWVQFVIPVGAGIATSIVLFDAAGRSLSDKKTVEYLKKLWSELNEFTLITLDATTPIMTPPVQEEIDEIVEVKGSSAPFEYQFPAAPEHFVGRSDVLKDIDNFIEDIINKRISARSIQLEADSGWGKSSVILASTAHANNNGHFTAAIDSRSASSPKFVLSVVHYVLEKFDDFNGLIPEDFLPKTITGFDGAIEFLVKIGKLLEHDQKVLLIVFDQFENLFFLPNVINRIRDLFLKIQDVQSNVVLGFAWKTDLFGMTRDFPYHIRDTIINLSKRIILDRFSEQEIDELLDKLRKEIGMRLRRDLRAQLSEFSQGYPWLLKKLCAHIKSQLDRGFTQADITSSQLNIEELFQEDLTGLSAEEEDTLRKIAKAAPIRVLELGDEFIPDVIQSLVNRRLVVRIGNKYDIYWDIFRDYLNTGHLPVPEARPEPRAYRVDKTTKIPILDKYFHYLEREVAKSTLETYDITLREFLFFVDDCFTKETIKRVKPENVENFFIWLENVRKLRKNTRLNKYLYLHAFFNWCVGQNYIRINPVQQAKKFVRPSEQAIEKETPKRPFFSEDEIHKILSKIKEEDLLSARDRALFRFAFYCASWLAEIRTLRVDCAFKDPTSQEWWITFRGYRRQRREHPLPERVLEHLEAYLTLRNLNLEPDQCKMQCDKCISPYMFTTKTGNPFTTNQDVIRRLKKYVTAAGLDSTHLGRTMRESAINLMVEKGMPLNLIQQFSGLKDLNVLQRYLR